MAELWRAKKSEQPRFTSTVVACGTGRVLAAQPYCKNPQKHRHYGKVNSQTRFFPFTESLEKLLTLLFQSIHMAHCKKYGYALSLSSQDFRGAREPKLNRHTSLKSGGQGGDHAEKKSAAPSSSVFRVFPTPIFVQPGERQFFWNG